MTSSLKWVGGGNDNASNAKDWSPDQKPAPGETLTMAVSGTMNIKGGVLAGDTLVVGGDDTLNLTNATLTRVNLGGYTSAPTTMNLTGDNSFALNLGDSDNSNGPVNINLGKDATWSGSISTSRLDLSQVTVNGGTFINDGTGVETEAVTFNCKVEGNGALIDNGTLTFLGAVSTTQTIEIQDAGRPGGAGTINIGDAAHFKGSILIDGPGPQSGAFGFINLAGLVQSTSYTFKNDILTLFDANKVVDTLKLTTPYGVSVDRTAIGISIYSGSTAQTNPQGTALPVHA